MALRPWQLAVALGCVLGCAHDLDSLSAGGAAADDGDRPPPGDGDGDDAPPGGDGDVAPPGDGDGDDDDPPPGDGEGVVDLEPCLPCEELGPFADELGLSSCCRGDGRLECGVRFAGAAGCAPRMVPGVPDAACPGVGAAAMQLDGCCRPDGECGFDADLLGVGCIARTQAPEAAGGPYAAIACDYSCEQDGDCAGLVGEWSCVPTGDERGGLCLEHCQRDANCEGADRVCAVTRDPAGGPSVSLCIPPQGRGEPGGACEAANDCTHGVCVQTSSAGTPYCSQLCATRGDCPWDGGRCITSELPGADGSLQEFSICVM